MTKFHIPEFYVQARKFKTPVFSFAKKSIPRLLPKLLVVLYRIWTDRPRSILFLPEALKNSRKNALTIDLMQKNGYYIQCR